MKSIKINFKIFLLPVVAVIVILSSCNKELQTFPPITSPDVTPPTGTTIAAYLSTNSNYSILDTALVTTGLYDAILNQPGAYTLFAPDDTTMKTFMNAKFAIPLAAPNAVFIGAIKGADAPTKGLITQILLYHIMISKVPTANFPTNAPNLAFPSRLPLDTFGAIHMSLFPSVKGGFSYINNIPIAVPDQFSGSNGVVHGLHGGLLVPPSGTLKTLIAGESTLSYFRAAIARADSGAVGLSKFDSLMSYGLTNMTVLAPSDNAFKDLIYALVFKNVYTATGNPVTADAQATGAKNAGPAFLSTNNVTTELVKGIMAYHLLAMQTADPETPFQPVARWFSVNYPALSPTPFFVPTLVNNALSIHPGVMVQATYTGPVVSSLKFSGVGSIDQPTPAPFAGTPANTISMDKNAVNGVYNIIDRVLLPQ